MGDQSKKSKKLGYWKAAMGLQQKNQKLLLDDHDDEFLLAKSKRTTTRTSAKLLSLIFLSFLSCFIFLSPYCFPAVDPSSSLAAMELNPPLSSSPPEDSFDSITDTNTNAPLSSSMLNYSFDSYPLVDTKSSASLPTFALNVSSRPLLDKNSSAPLPSSASMTHSFEFHTDEKLSASQPSSTRNVHSFEFLTYKHLSAPPPSSAPSALSSESHNNTNSSVSLPSSIRNETIWCDRNGFRSDICFMRGDIRTQSTTSSLFLYTSPNATTAVVAAGEEPNVTQHEKIRPYTRKWETSVMNTIDELHLIISTPKENQQPPLHCDVKHDVPAVFFSTGGYTGNVYHEFNDGLIPLYITSHHFNKRVVIFILEYHTWWISKYADILSEISDYPAIDFSGDNRTHCFPEAIVGLRIHDELTIDPALIQGTKENKTIVDFRNLLDRAYWPRIRWLIHEEDEEERKSQPPHHHQHQRHADDDIKPKLVIVSRTGSRAITNENSLVHLAEAIGFRVEVLKPDSRTELAKIYRSLNSSDAMIGVHGAAMTHFLFMRPGCVFIQVIPLGTEWASESYYGTPARKMGLKYIGYRIFPRESSLFDKYEESDPVLRDPESVSAKGWQYTKSIYLDGQNVVLDLKRFEKRLMVAYNYAFGIVTRQRRDRGAVGEGKKKRKKRRHKEEEKVQN